MVSLVQSKEDLEKQLVEAGEKLVVIDFFATWCGPCKIIAPKLEELAIQYKDQAVVLKVDVDECEDIVVAYKVISMPTFVFIKNQKIIDMFVGGNTDKLVKTVEKHVGDGKAADSDATATNDDGDSSDNNGDQPADEEEGAVGGVAIAPANMGGAVEESQQAVES